MAVLRFSASVLVLAVMLGGCANVRVLGPVQWVSLAPDRADTPVRLERDSSAAWREDDPDMPARPRKPVRRSSQKSTSSAAALVNDPNYVYSDERVLQRERAAQRVTRMICTGCLGPDRRGDSSNLLAVSRASDNRRHEVRLSPENPRPEASPQDAHHDLAGREPGGPAGPQKDVQNKGDL